MPRFRAALTPTIFPASASSNQLSVPALMPVAVKIMSSSSQKISGLEAFGAGMQQRVSAGPGMGSSTVQPAFHHEPVSPSPYVATDTERSSSWEQVSISFVVTSKQAFQVKLFPFIGSPRQPKKQAPLPPNAPASHEPPSFSQDWQPINGS